ALVLLSPLTRDSDKCVDFGGDGEVLVSPLSLGGAAVDAEKSKAAGVEALRAKKRLTKLLSQCSQFDILASLHPSPAVCGFPTEEARLFIAETGVSLFLCFCGGLEVSKEPDLQERHLGDLQGLVLREVAKVSTKAYQAFFSQSTDQEIPGSGESLDQLYEHCTSSLERIGRKHKDEEMESLGIGN
ncbi:uncharacterized protein LOC115978703, partial [Quercus lobata]|uniref:uncharacterized protein LOC115978703 n=1 Tax=Quercus lobata TaxID=97700 RepID=UPI0012474B91